MTVSASVAQSPGPELSFPTGPDLLPPNGEFAAKFNRTDFLFDHGLAHHPMFEPRALLGLANRIPKYRDFVYWQNGRVKVNPLAFWSADRIAAEFDRRELPRHPLEAYGFLSVGCTTCTAAVTDGADRRAGRWPGQAKTACGIHLPEPAFA